MRKLLIIIAAISTALDLCAATPDQRSGSAIYVPGLQTWARVVRDSNDVPNITGGNDHDLLYVQGYVEAQDRLFQMDVSRRKASGTLAELVGASALPQDVQLRTMGLRRAAERSLPLQTARVSAMLRAYADGVNAYSVSHPLPPEYAILKVTRFEPWTPVDSLAIAKLIAFAETFQSDAQPTVDLLTYQATGRSLGFDGSKLFFDDVQRSAPFDPASTVVDASMVNPSVQVDHHRKPMSTDFIRDCTIDMAKEFDRKIRNMDLLRGHPDGQPGDFSNEWAIGGAFTSTGLPLMANDPHLDLGTPSTWYPIHLQAGDLNVVGEGLPGVPLVVVGHNRFLAWGLTDDPLDTWDSYQEKIVSDGNSPSGFSTLYLGALEPIIPIPEIYRVNSAGVLTTVPAGGAIPAATLIVPRRNNGPLVAFDPQKGTGISVQWTGFSGSRELEAILAWTEARNLKEFREGLSLFSAPTENLAYSDVYGNIAYFAIGEVPVREDLQAGTVNGLPPWFLRNGTGGNEWLPVAHSQPNQSVPFEILPASELPHLVNPPAGFFVNANNDPVGITVSNDPLGTLRPGGGIYYLAYNFKFGFRGARITQMIRERMARGPILPHDMAEMQADVNLLDAQVFVPFIIQALANAHSTTNPTLAALAANPALNEAVARLASWDRSTPTGIPEGYDAGDPPGPLHPRSADEVARSVAATVYSVWRGQFLANTIDTTLGRLGLVKPPEEQSLAALRHMLDSFPAAQGIGASGVNFFNVPGIATAVDRRDLVILQSLSRTLDLLAGPTFQDAFAGSRSLDDYRWGKLHRISFVHVLGEPFSIPSAGGAFPQPLAKLPGIPTDGGFQTVDAANHSVRAADENSFMFSRGPSKRSVFVAQGRGMESWSSLPGGISGVLGSTFYFNLLPAWLRNESYKQSFTKEDLRENSLFIEDFLPAVQ